MNIDNSYFTTICNLNKKNVRMMFFGREMRGIENLLRK